jgi:LemA protein
MPHFTGGQIAAFATAAILLFWMVGGYNRLVALRSAIGSAWALVDEVLKKRGDAVQALIVALRAPLAAEQSALDALQAAERQVRSAAEQLGTRPVDTQLAAALVAAEAAMASAASRVLALLEQHEALRQDAAVAPPAAVLRDSVARLVFSRQLFNEAAETYNAAARLFPTRLLAELYRFGPAGRL